MKQKYSAVIIAKNESLTIGNCIRALKNITDDIIIVLDDRSEDNTESIAVELGAKVFLKSWEGYSANKNYGATKAKYEWIICVDADEILDELLISNILNLQPDDSHVYEMNRQTFFGDYPVRHCGWFPDWNIRLFNKKVMTWNENFVHEKLISVHPLKHIRIAGLLSHYSFHDEAHMVKKFDTYARLRSEEWKKAGKNPSFLKRHFGPGFRFFRTYVLKRGFLDGKVGLTIAKNEYILKQKELKYFKLKR